MAEKVMASAVGKEGEFPASILAMWEGVNDDQHQGFHPDDVHAIVASGDDGAGQTDGAQDIGDSSEPVIADAPPKIEAPVVSDKSATQAEVDHYKALIEKLIDNNDKLLSKVVALEPKPTAHEPDPIPDEPDLFGDLFKDDGWTEEDAALDQANPFLTKFTNKALKAYHERMLKMQAKQAQEIAKLKQQLDQTAVVSQEVKGTTFMQQVKAEVPEFDSIVHSPEWKNYMLKQAPLFPKGVTMEALLSDRAKNFDLAAVKEIMQGFSAINKPVAAAGKTPTPAPASQGISISTNQSGKRAKAVDPEAALDMVRRQTDRNDPDYRKKINGVLDNLWDEKLSGLGF